MRRRTCTQAIGPSPMLNLAARARPYLGAVVLTAGLLTAGGIYSATRMPSGDLPESEVEARPGALLAAGLSAADLADQIGKAHVLQPVGRIERPPLAFQILVNTYGQSVQHIEDLMITTRNNQALPLHNLA